MRTIWAAVVAVAMGGCISGTASAAVLFTNPPTEGYGSDSHNISDVFAAADPFSLSSASVVDGVAFDAWTSVGETAISVDYRILNAPPSPSATVLASGTAALSNGILRLAGALGGSFDVRGYQFAIPDLSLGAGTYWLELSQGETDPDGDFVFWNDAGASPSGVQIFDGSPSSIPGQTFSILGPSAAVPEPATWALMIGGFGTVGAMMRRRVAAA